jgi:cation diffusion facilitator family transporter
MAEDCCDRKGLEPLLKGAKWALWFALIVNFVMFFVELGASFKAESESLKADSLDFLSDSFSYAITLFVLNKSAQAKNRSAAIKGWLMTLLGLWVFISAIYKIWSGTLPEAPIMGLVGSIALLANLAVALVLFQYRSRDLNMQSVWLCSRNDVIANLAVLLAAAGVWSVEARWPDMIVAGIISFINLRSGVRILHDAGELTQGNQQKWKDLQADHILAQPNWFDHTRVHFQMLGHAFRSHSVLEIPVQIMFIIVSIPSSLLKVYPINHPGTLSIKI